MTKKNDCIKNLYNKPSFKFRPAKSTPIAKDYNSMVKEAYDDLQRIINSFTKTYYNLEKLFKKSENERNEMRSSLKYIDLKLKDLQGKVEGNISCSEILFADYFLNKDYTEGEFTDAYINSGMLTLNMNLESEDIKDSKIEILPSSNGFPGNTHMVNTENDAIHFLGESNLNMDLNNILDDRDDTYFEYEMFNIDKAIIDKCHNLGFEYKEKVPFNAKDNCLKLTFKISLEEPKFFNCLSLAPYVPLNSDFNSASIKKFIISDGLNTLQDIPVNRPFSENMLLIFKPQLVAFVIVELQQISSYDGKIGHFYFTDAGDSSIFEAENTLNCHRINGTNPSIENLGMKYDNELKKYTGPKNFNEANCKITYLDNETIKKKLFYEPKYTLSARCSTEIIDAKRYLIGIKNVALLNYSFRESGTYISKTFQVKQGVKAIILDSQEFIPEAFDKGKYISYFVCFNGDNDWIEIFPKHRASEGNFSIELNSSITEDERKINTLYLEKPYEATSINLKIVLARPVDKASMTPIVYSYNLDILTRGDSIEY
ncbi:hypothetical protein [Clostridium felsineum]|uniref:hypothetical protein n=1 Tax=Clostridium felsineum TaxID=36839 RepID=UPI00098C8F03|nr:hypothetical protein [Clostridium felsineum]URZ18547.1 hypothetical protein CLFE_046350 [Clostridium felsineum DSM 794]